jgi:hypothetical protein
MEFVSTRPRVVVATTAAAVLFPSARESNADQQSKQKQEKKRKPDSDRFIFVLSLLIRLKQQQQQQQQPHNERLENQQTLNSKERQTSCFTSLHPFYSCVLFVSLCVRR